MKKLEKQASIPSSVESFACHACTCGCLCNCSCAPGVLMQSILNSPFAQVATSVDSSSGGTIYQK